ncbi:MAG TPA: alpha/beta hydrolase [Stellaceae bacterium]|nr:alpha/beta hydrolase [Stellaceae bacterium]
MNESRVEIRGVGLHLRRGGKGAPLLFLHGVQGLPAEVAALERLAERFEVLAPDHPGFGRSDAPDWLEDVGDLAFFYLDLLDALDLEGVHVVGASLGGWIAMEMAIRSEARIKSLTLADAAGIRVAGVPRSDMFIANPAELQKLLFAKEAAAAEWFAHWQGSPEGLATYDKNRHAAAKFTWQPRLYDPRLEKWLHRIKLPTQLVWGAEDRLIPPAHAERLAALIPGAETAMLPDCGHMAEIERPELFADTVSRFIERKRP